MTSAARLLGKWRCYSSERKASSASIREQPPTGGPAPSRDQHFQARTHTGPRELPFRDKRLIDGWCARGLWEGAAEKRVCPRDRYEVSSPARVVDITDLRRARRPPGPLWDARARGTLRLAQRVGVRARVDRAACGSNAGPRVQLVAMACLRDLGRARASHHTWCTTEIDRCVCAVQRWWLRVSSDC